MAPISPKLTGEVSPGSIVLFVDDEEAVRRLAKSALERSGWRVLLAENGAKGVQLFEEQQENIALVILDWAMPVMGGAEALERINDPRWCPGDCFIWLQ